MNKNEPQDAGKTRQNVSLSPSTKELFAKLAKDNDSTMSALLTQWILEKSKEAPQKEAHIRGRRSVKPNRANTRGA